MQLQSSIVIVPGTAEREGLVGLYTFLKIIKSYYEKSVFCPTTLSHLSAPPLSKQLHGPCVHQHGSYDVTCKPRIEIGSEMYFKTKKVTANGEMIRKHFLQYLCKFVTCQSDQFFHQTGVLN